ncbi:integrase arm-type DNA-binding domain-containing protein [Geothrix sp. 21YS21S-4]|uniref:tyrosine-type recombinase/integrase n=1 Tax=Geothrix sp. 21YS21S-4 TaxID=3068889 RepID=UPI0027BAB38A|nr:integrase arm-type DNA-binding domain-containing protein [Geothrix sp. 21YS21S-4]
MPLTDVKIRQAKPGPKPIKLSDERGLYLEVAPGGGKWWRLKYRFEGKEKRLSLGIYPDVGLKEARERRDEARKLLADGVDPSLHRKAIRQAREDEAENTFEVVAREWHAKNAHTWVAEHRDGLLRRLDRDIFPWIGKRPVGDITAPELLAVIRRIEARGALETAHRALSTCGQVFRYAIATGRAQRDVAADLQGALPRPQVKHLASTTDPGRLGELLRTVDTYQGTLATRCALRLAPLTFVRPGELRTAEWAAMDLEAAEWRFQASKGGPPHIVPLSTQAMAILKELQPLTGKGRYVFPGARSSARPMSENTVNAALRRLDIPKEELCGHGFRAAARTILDEVLGFRPDIIEHQLAHKVKDPNGRAYNRTAHLPERRKMMQLWADYFDQIKG